MGKEALLLWLVKMAFERLTSEDIKVWADKGLDLLEDKIIASESKWDDRVALPMIQLIRTAFDIEDGDD